MIIVMKSGATGDDVRHVVERIEELGLKAHVSQGTERTVIGIIGDERFIKKEQLSLLPHVDDVIPILKPYKSSSPTSQAFAWSGTAITFPNFLLK